MRKKTAIILIIAFAVLLHAGNTSAVLLERGIDPLFTKGGARPLSLGGAYVGVCDDTYSIFYNPAGIARTKGMVFGASDIGNFIAGEIYPTGYGASMGFGIVRNTVPDFKYLGATNESSASTLVASLGTRLGFISDLAGSLDFFRDIDVGITFKYALGQSLRTTNTAESDRSATGWDMDAGMLWRPTQWIKAGLVIENFLAPGSGAGALKWDTGYEDEIKSKTNIGVSFKVIGDNRSPIYLDDNELILASDFILRDDAPKTLIYSGAEWTHAGTYMVRVGMNQYPKGEEAASGLAGGFGVRLGNWGADASYSIDRFTEGPVYYFSFLYFPRDWSFVKKTAEPTLLPKKTEAKEEKPERPEQIKISGPQDELVTDTDTVKVKGTVLKTGTKVYVDNNLAQVDSGGNFEVELPLNVGKNYVEIVSESDGKQTYVKKKILRKAKVVTPEDIKIEEKVQKEIKPQEEKIVRTEEEIRPKEIKIAVAEKKVEELEKEPLSEPEKKALEIEKKKIEAQKKEIELAKAKLEEAKKKLDYEKKKVEAERAAVKEKKAAVEDLATIGVIDVSPNKVFEVESAITRGELASWLVKARGISTPKPTRAPFPDVAADHPYAPQIKAAVGAGLIGLKPDGTFKPNEPVTEKDGIEIFKKFYGK